MTVVDTPHGRRPQLRYLRGAACPADPHTQLSATIEFYCAHRAGRGRPLLTAVHEDCHYGFEWATNVICEEHAVEYRGGVECELYSNRTEQHFDLRRLGDEGNLAVSGWRDDDDDDDDEAPTSMITARLSKLRLRARRSRTCRTTSTSTCAALRRTLATRCW